MEQNPELVKKKKHCTKMCSNKKYKQKAHDFEETDIFHRRNEVS